MKQSLNDKYEIPFGSTWKHKDGGTYTALTISHTFGASKIPTVCYFKNLEEQERKEWRENGIHNQFVKTVNHFKNSFTMIEEMVDERKGNH